MATDFRIVVLISGRGTNLKSLIEAAQHYKIAQVISNKSAAPGLAIAAARGIPTSVITRDEYRSLDEQKEAILQAVRSARPDLVVLAGFMQILPPTFVDIFQDRIVNIHPSLLPKFVGLDTHARALAAGERVHGCTAHLVDSGLDSGAIIAQAAVRVDANDTAESLGAKVLEREHDLYPWVINAFAQGQILTNRGNLSFSEGLITEAQMFGFSVGSPPR